MNCTHCKKPLNRVQYSKDWTLKSCPNCSVAGGTGAHVFRAYPGAFGRTTKRASAKKPDGPQSWCTECRGRKGPMPGTACSNIV